MPLSGDSLTLHKPRVGSESQFFRLQTGNKSFLLPQDGSHFLPENCYSYPNALNTT